MMANDGEMLKEWPNIAKHSEPSLDARWEILSEEVPKLAKESAMSAIKEWGQPISKITHLIFCTNSGADCPGADCRLVHLLGLPTTVKRIMLYYQGCHGGATALRLAKDFAENNRGARVLVVTCEYTLHAFRGPSESNPDDLIVQALFGDGSASLIVGADPDLNIERPIFELVSTRQTMILNTMEDKIQLREVGNLITIAPSFAKHISENIGDCVEEALKPLDITDLNSLFWIVHPGGPKTLKVIEEKLELSKEKLVTTKKVLANVGNLSSPTILFIMDEMRKKSIEECKPTTGDGHEYGMLIGYGPGISIETIVLRSVPV
ncbi:Stilbene synthase [Rhynchospora pubera]|uniref:chalcone synthase n=1 Tax=Rhynchospora pubera TaxID=906938 RepID=A0AAV8C6N4_9POAL|nr:Stilbene synthase [Rhynchospora pubera]